MYICHATRIILVTLIISRSPASADLCRICERFSSCSFRWASRLLINLSRPSGIREYMQMASAVRSLARSKSDGLVSLFSLFPPSSLPARAHFAAEAYLNDVHKIFPIPLVPI